MPSITPLFSDDEYSSPSKSNPTVQSWSVILFLISLFTLGVTGYFILSTSSVSSLTYEKEEITSVPKVAYEEEALLMPMTLTMMPTQKPNRQTSRQESPFIDDTFEQQARRIIARLNSILKGEHDEN